MPDPTPVLPEVLTQIRALPESPRPLIICDVDEVVLHMILHLEDYLAQNGLKFLTNEYRLNGNIGAIDSAKLLAPGEVRRHLLSFFEDFAHRQDMVTGADTALGQLSSDWDVVFLTNLPGDNKSARETLLGSLGFSFPVLTNSGPKGGAVSALSARRKGPVVFIDDSPANHTSVNASLPSAVQVQFVADPRFLAAITLEDHIDLLTGDWQETAAFIERIL